MRKRSPSSSSRSSASAAWSTACTCGSTASRPTAPGRADIGNPPARGRGCVARRQPDHGDQAVARLHEPRPRRGEARGRADCKRLGWARAVYRPRARCSGCGSAGSAGRSAASPRAVARASPAGTSARSRRRRPPARSCRRCRRVNSCAGAHFAWIASICSRGDPGGRNAATITITSRVAVPPRRRVGRHPVERAAQVAQHQDAARWTPCTPTSVVDGRRRSDRRRTPCRR